MNTRNSTILVIDDERDSRMQLVQLLQAEGYTTAMAANGEKALAAISASPPDLILLDVTMPGMDGFAVASKLKLTPATANIPIIMVSAHAGRGARVVGLGSGAEEYLTKPVDPAELSLKVHNLLRLKLIAGTAAVGGLSSDAAAVEPRHEAFYDAVTGLPNAEQFRGMLRKVLAEAGTSGATVSLLSVDVDNFKQINGNLGIEFGDQLLRHIGTQLVQQAGNRDAVGRLNEDKFAVVLCTGDGDSALAAADVIRSLLRVPFTINGKDVSPTASVGVALFPLHGCDPESLIQHADAARRVAKRAGGDASRLHDTG